MDKNIDENDRIVIGVREWAVEKGKEFLAGWSGAEDITSFAKELEEFILRGITVPNQFLECKGRLYFSDGEGIKVVET